MAKVKSLYQGAINTVAQAAGSAFGVGNGPYRVVVASPLPLPTSVTNFPAPKPSPYANAVQPALSQSGLGQAAVTAIQAEGEAGGKMGKVVAGVVLVGAALYAFADKVVETGSRFAQIANPATVNLYDRAVLDAEAVLGQRFTPAVEIATAVMQGVGDFFQEILPSTSEFRDQLMQLNPAIAEVKGIARDLAPTIKAVFETGLQIAGANVKVFAQTIQYAVEWVRDLTGIKIGEGPQGTARGMAAANATVGGVDDVSRRMFQSALEQGRHDEPAILSANYLGAISGFLTGKLASFLDAWADVKIWFDWLVNQFIKPLQPRIAYFLR